MFLLFKENEVGPVNTKYLTIKDLKISKTDREGLPKQKLLWQVLGYPSKYLPVYDYTWVQMSKMKVLGGGVRIHPHPTEETSPEMLIWVHGWIVPQEPNII